MSTAEEKQMRFWLPALIAMAVLPASAHHPFTPYYDASRPASITGVIVEFRNINPHVVLVINGTGPDGRTGLWAFEGSAPNAFLRRQPDYKQRLTAGTTITISGWSAKDPQASAFSGNTVTFADGTKMLFGLASPQDGDRWRCSSDPCPYTYPDVRPQ
jgi:hypothetical protein